MATRAGESLPSYLDTLAKIMPRGPAAPGAAGDALRHRAGRRPREERRGASAPSPPRDTRSANHSFRHEPWFHLYTRQEIDDEVARAEEAIEKATGRRPVGFRGPGYSLSADTLRVLVGRGYQYDCSTLPTFLGPLARAYYFWKSRGMPDAERDKRRKLFGSLRDGLQPIRPYNLVGGRPAPGGDPGDHHADRARAVPHELPALPDALLAAGREGHLKTALALCRATGVHAVVPPAPARLSRLRSGEGAGVLPRNGSADQRQGRVRGEVLKSLTATYDVVTLEEHARAVGAAPTSVVRRMREERALG